MMCRCPGEGLWGRGLCAVPCPGPWHPWAGGFAALALDVLQALWGEERLAGADGPPVCLACSRELLTHHQ